MLIHYSVGCGAHEAVLAGPGLTFERECAVAIIDRRSWMERASRSKRLSCASFLAARVCVPTLVTVVACAACMLAAGCDGGHDDLAAQSSAADATPVLPGTRGAVGPSTSSGAQRFDTASGSSERDGPGALLPPVMHTAD
ncbi:hypothetical protein [Trinickia acidisoli]|uniref:hypothetical protein n=1 Tax=Trinickia acidisoli TaxID=2767482 RepID=UPI001A8FD7D8|nr:hypothetical protein [Trinickia acidisoli]